MKDLEDIIETLAESGGIDGLDFDDLDLSDSEIYSNKLIR